YALIEYGACNLYPAVYIPGHKVGGGYETLFISVITGYHEPAVLKAPVNNAPGLYAFAYFHQSGYNGYHPSYNKLNIYTGRSCLVQIINNFSICEIVKFKMDICFLSGFCIFNFIFY